MIPIKVTSPENYQDIFNRRADAYHDAMIRWPSARNKEFEAIIELAEIAPGAVIADIPSGGGYLAEYIIDESIQLLAVEPSMEFYARCKTSPRLRKILSPLEQLDIVDGSVDTIISLAGLHHVADRSAVFGEFRRILRPGGVLCIADVRAGSAIDGFLNGFVNQYNSMSHNGWFINTKFKQQLVAAGFTIEINKVASYTWDFTDTCSMSEYCTLLFGLDQAGPKDVLDGINRYQGYCANQSSCRMNWELEHLRCSR